MTETQIERRLKAAEYAAKSWQQSCEQANAREERYETALKPFADAADFYDDCEQHPNGCPDSAQAGEMVDLTVGDFRRARAALQPNKETGR